MKLNLINLSFVITVFFMIGGCAMIEDMEKTHHQSNSSSKVVKCSMKQLEPAVRKSLEELRYHVTAAKIDQRNGCFEGENFTLTYKEIASGEYKLMLRCGMSGDKDLEKRLFEEIMKNLK